MDGLTEGRIIHFVLPDGPNKGEHRAAMIVKVWRNNAIYLAGGTVNIQVFTDCSNDGPNYGAGMVWRCSVNHDPYGAPGTWHWPEKA